MPFIDFDKTKQNLGSSNRIVEYLEKENSDKNEKEKEFFFSHDNDSISPEEVTKALDSNNRKLTKKEEKYFSFHISPSKKELDHINNSIDGLKSYVRNVMDIYANNFDKGLTGNDMLYFAKVEQNRKFTNLDPEVREGTVKKGDDKKGNQTHIHILVSRRVKNNGPRVSPKETAKGGKNFYLPEQIKKDGTVVPAKRISRGFNMNSFKEKAELHFDLQFDYRREENEKFDYMRLQKHYPKDFSLKYGQENYKAPVNYRILDNTNKGTIYIKNKVNEGISATGNKQELEEYLSQKGIKQEKGKFRKSKESIEINPVNFPTNNKLLSTYYLAKQLNKKKDKFRSNEEQEQDQEQENS